MLDELILKIRRGDRPFYSFLRGIAKGITAANLPVPRLLRPALRAWFSAHTAAVFGFRWAVSFFYREPLFRSRCESAGRNLFVAVLPEISGHARIFVGNNVKFYGKTGIYSGRIFDEPRLIVKDRVDIGHNVTFVVNREIIIEEDVNISTGVRIMDTDSHPRDAEARIADLPPAPDEIKPVRLCRGAWIGQNTFILKGVTIGEGAIIGVNSVVMTDIPPFAVALGNPARVVFKGAAPAAGLTK